MATLGMNHFTVLTDDVPGTVAFYAKFLGLSDGARPAATASPGSAPSCSSVNSPGDQVGTGGAGSATCGPGSGAGGAEPVSGGGVRAAGGASGRPAA